MAFFDNKKIRFEIVYREPSIQVIVDKNTGVNYMLVISTSNGGVAVTPLLNKDGNPIITE